jgi:hypothetical protein
MSVKKSDQFDFLTNKNLPYSLGSEYGKFS